MEANSLPYASITSYTSLSQALSETDDDPIFCDETVPSKYSCIECKHLLRNPMQTECGHRICRNCFELKLEEIESFECPAKEEDCVTISRSNVIPDNSVIRELNAQIVKCNNYKEGCKDIMMLRKLKAHLAVCLFRLMVCINDGCPITASIAEIEKHQLECEYQSVPCEHCGISIAKIRLILHEETECLQILMDCPHKCGERNILRANMAKHLQTCSARCKFHTMGCDEHGDPQHLDEHEIRDTARHLELAMLSVANSAYEMTLMKGVHESLTIQIDQLKEIVERRNKEFEDLKKSHASLVESLKQNEASTLKLVTSQNERIDILSKRLAEYEEKMGIAYETYKVTAATNDAYIREIKEKQKELETRGLTGATNVAALPRAVQTTIEVHETQLGIHNVRLTDFDLRLQCMETTNYEGLIIWKISEYSRRKREATTPGGNVSLYSQPFFSGRYGYKMCARVYLNGDGAGRGTHISLFFVIMQGDYDDIILWPFRLKVTMMLLDQRNHRRHLSDAFRPDPTSSSFQKPTAPMNIASGCPLFVAHRVLESDDTYLRNDALYFKIFVESETVA